MTHRGPFQPLPFCDSVKSIKSKAIKANIEAAQMELIKCTGMERDGLLPKQYCKNEVSEDN